MRGLRLDGIVGSEMRFCWERGWRVWRLSGSACRYHHMGARQKMATGELVRPILKAPQTQPMAAWVARTAKIVMQLAWH